MRNWFVSLACLLGLPAFAFAGGGGIQHHRCESKKLELSVEFDGAPRNALAKKGTEVDASLKGARHPYVVEAMVVDKTETRVTMKSAAGKPGFGALTLTFFDAGNKVGFTVAPATGKPQQANDVECSQTN